LVVRGKNVISGRSHNLCPFVGKRNPIKLKGNLTWLARKFKQKEVQTDVLQQTTNPEN
jgi:hypothetical protein